MNSRTTHKQVQGNVSNKQPNEYQKFQDAIEKEYPGMSVSVLVLPDKISIRTELYSDYVLARKSIMAMAGSTEIVRDEIKEP